MSNNVDVINMIKRLTDFFLLEYKKIHRDFLVTHFQTWRFYDLLFRCKEAASEDISLRMDALANKGFYM